MMIILIVVLAILLITVIMHCYVIAKRHDYLEKERDQLAKDKLRLLISESVLSTQLSKIRDAAIYDLLAQIESNSEAIRVIDELKKTLKETIQFDKDIIIKKNQKLDEYRKEIIRLNTKIAYYKTEKV